MNGRGGSLPRHSDRIRVNSCPFVISSFLMNSVNETLIRDVVAEVLARLNGAPPAPAAQADCGCNGKGRPSAPGLRGKFGVFQDANEACASAQEAFELLRQKGV